MPRYKAQIHSSEEEQLRQTSAEGILRKKNPSMDKREEIDKDDQGTNDGCNEDDDVTIATQRISNVTNAGEAAAAARRFQKKQKAAGTRKLTRQEFKRKAADDDSFRDELFDLYVMAKEPRNSDDATDYISDVSEGSSTKGGKTVDVGKTLSQSLNTKSNNVNTNDDANAKRADSHKPRTGSNRLATLPKDAEDNDSLTYSKNSKSKDKTVSSDKVTYVDRRDSDQLDATGASASLHSSKIAGDLSKTNDSDGVGASASSDFKKSARVNQNNNAAKDIQDSQNIQGGSTDASVESSLLAGVDAESHASPCDVAAV